MHARAVSLFLALLLLLPVPAAFGAEPKGEQNSTKAQTPKGLISCPASATSLDGLIQVRSNASADKFGEISVAQPKIWQFERVSALLDGLLRDVEGVSLSDLTQLDPNQQNAAALKFVQSALEVGVQYDQAAAVNAANTLNSYNAVHASEMQQLDQYDSYVKTLAGERNRLAAQLIAATNSVNALQAYAAAGTITPEQQQALEQAQSRVASTSTALTSVNSLITGSGAAPTLTAPPTLAGTSVGAPASGSTLSSSLSAFSDVLKNLPQGVQNNLSNSLQAPTFPATKRLDNFITLLYERLAREISTLQDDLTRDPDNVAFLVQFDVGLYPSKSAKDDVARVQFDLKCPGCKVYSLYPGQSSYNIANFSGSSKRVTFWGNVLTLLGFGASASYRRQTDELHGSLVQSVYEAGFQSGVSDKSAAGSNQDTDSTVQSFGWYYAPAPFEKLVSPGIRTTFALITVPRKLIENSEDVFGKPNACVPLDIAAGWASRNDPLARDSSFSLIGEGAKVVAAPAYWPTRDRLTKPDDSPTNGAGSNDSDRGKADSSGQNYDDSVLQLRASLKLPTALDDFPSVARRENKMHVVRLEYNTVYEQPDSTASAASVQTTVQTSTQSANSSTGQVTGQTTTQTTTQTTGTQVGSPNSRPDNGGATAPSSSLDPLPCPKDRCAAVVIKLDRPIDPNLVVTVQGKPLLRVRDWRGRATSVLPAAQSGTDLSAPASTAGSLAMNQLRSTRGLLETDQFAANTWFQLNSHELLLNVSDDVATQDKFPVIQLADPSGSVVIPHDLRRSFTEVLINGFRMKPYYEHSIQQEARRQNWPDLDESRWADFAQDDALMKDALDKGATKKADMEKEAMLKDALRNDAPISSDPYPFSTFLPLFSPKPTPRKFFAIVGETGNDLLIGFLPSSVDQKNSGKATRANWLAAQTQVILRDRDKDFAWSLSCDVQGNLLACTLPRKEISRVYWNFLQSCPDSDHCPGLSTERMSLINSRETLFEQAIAPLGDDAKKQTHLSAEEKADLFHLQSSPRDLSAYPQAYVSTMQVRVQQADQEGKDVFYSPDLATIGYLPLSDDYWGETPFRAWDFDGADPDGVTLRECKYLPTHPQSDVQVSLLGVRSWPDWLRTIDPSNKLPVGWTALKTGMDGDSTNPDCGNFRIPTAALANDPVVFVMAFPPHDTKHRATIALPRSRIAPSFGKPEVRMDMETEKTPDGKTQVEPKGWKVDIPVVNSACGDDLNLPNELLHPDNGDPISKEWRRGGRTYACDAKDQQQDKAWQQADKAESLSLYLNVPRTAMQNLPDHLEVVRTSQGVQWRVATLPDLRSLLLPSQLTLEALDANRFVLRGENANVIDAVVLQGSSEKNTATIPTARGVDFALVTVPAQSSDSSKASTDTSGGGTASNSSTQITIDTSKDSTGHVQMTTQSSTAPGNADAASSNKTDSPTSDMNSKSAGQLAPGSYAVLPLMKVGETPASATAVDDAAAKVKASAAAAQAQKDAQQKADSAKNAAAAPQAKADATAKVAAQKATEAKAVAASKTATAEEKAKARSASALAAKQAAAAANVAKKQTAIAATAKTELTAKTDAATKAKTAADEAAVKAMPTPIYMPLNVTDDKSKPLVFTIADKTKQAATTPAGPTPQSQVQPSPATPAKSQ